MSNPGCCVCPNTDASQRTGKTPLIGICVKQEFFTAPVSTGCDLDDANVTQVTVGVKWRCFEKHLLFFYQVWWKFRLRVKLSPLLTQIYIITNNNNQSCFRYVCVIVSCYMCLPRSLKIMFYAVLSKLEMNHFVCFCPLFSRHCTTRQFDKPAEGLILYAARDGLLSSTPVAAPQRGNNDEPRQRRQSGVEPQTAGVLLKFPQVSSRVLALPTVASSGLCSDIHFCFPLLRCSLFPSADRDHDHSSSATPRQVCGRHPLPPARTYLLPCGGQSKHRPRLEGWVSDSCLIKYTVNVS